MINDIKNELKTNFIEYAVAVNTDRAIPDAKSGLKPVAKESCGHLMRVDFLIQKLM